MANSRKADLPDGVKGILLLSSMPGREGSYEDARELIRSEGITGIVCLAPMDEVRGNSPAYADEIEMGSLPCPIECFPIRDGGCPEDGKARELSTALAVRLHAGERVLMHCGAGVGRTGTMAACVLIALGMSLEAALPAVEKAGSHPETLEQCRFLVWFAAHR